MAAAPGAAAARVAAAAAPSKKRCGGEPDADLAGAPLAAADDDAPRRRPLSGVWETDDDGALDADRSHAVAWDAAPAAPSAARPRTARRRALRGRLRVDLFDDGGDPDAKEILPLLPRACGDRYGRDSPLPGAARHRRLETLLRVFSGAAAPRSLPHGDALRAVYERLLGKPRGDVASLALAPRALQGAPLAPYAARAALLDDDAAPTRRKLGRCREARGAGALDAFLVLMFRPLLPSGGLDSLAPLRGREDAERAVAACSESRVSGLLQLLRAVVAKLGYRVEAHAGTFLGVVLAVLDARGEAEEEAVEDEEEDDEEEEVVDGSKSRRKRERHLALKCCKELLDQFAESDVLWAVDGGLKERLWAPLGRRDSTPGPRRRWAPPLAAAAAAASHGKTWTAEWVATTCLPHVMGALELGDDGPRRAAVSALGAAAAKSSATFLAPAVALKRFANDNADLDLFENVAHLQAHRRARALKRWRPSAARPRRRARRWRGSCCPGAPALYDARAQDALVKEAAACVGVVASALPWSRYGQLAKRLATVIENQARLHERLSRPKANSQQAPSGAASRKEKPKFRDMQLQSSKALEATFVAAFCHVLDNFHFLDGADDAMDVEEEEEDEEEEEEDAEEEEEEADAPAQPPKADKVSAGLHGWLLPTARRLLKKPVRAPKTGARDEVLRAPVALAILRLAAKLPAAARDSETRGLVVSVCGGLRHRDATQRDVGRATLARMVVFLSPSCLPLVLRELKAALHSGYMLAVRARRGGRRARDGGGPLPRRRRARRRGLRGEPVVVWRGVGLPRVAILTRTGVVTRDAAPDVDESDSDDDSDDGSLAPLAMDEADMVPRRVRTNAGAATAWLPSAGDASSSKAEALARKRKREQENVAVIDGASAPKLTGRDRHGGVLERASHRRAVRDEKSRFAVHLLRFGLRKHKLQSCDDAVKATATPLLGMLARAYRGLRGDEEPQLGVGDGAQGAFKMLAALGGKSDDGYEVSLADAQLKAVASSVRAALSESALADDDSFASNRAATYALLLAMVRRPVVVAEIYDVMDAASRRVSEETVTTRLGRGAPGHAAER
ncbi:hypothetical protein JL721_12810 [Aureococcus anophagefferens]|nr:hypothetical protein JL721_12810 [Aureococcus anophagefferens]